MNNKIIITEGFLIIFLMLMIPIVNSVEYSLVEKNFEEKIIQSNEKNKLKNIISSYKLEDFEKLKDFVYIIKNNPDSLCSNCKINRSMRPLCKILLKQCLYFLLLYSSLSSFIVADYFLIIAGAMFLSALGIGCLWAIIIFSLTGFNQDTTIAY